MKNASSVLVQLTGSTLVLRNQRKRHKYRFNSFHLFYWFNSLKTITSVYSTEVFIINIYMKEILWSIAVVLTFVGYIPYIRDIILGKTEPHVYTWLILSIAGIGIYITQVQHSGWAGSWMMLFATIISFIVTLLSVKYGKKYIKPVDHYLLGICLIALLLVIMWINPLLSVILLIICDMTSFIPTLRKSWYYPHTETASLYAISAIRYGISILALTTINAENSIFLGFWVILNVFTFTLIVTRRKAIQFS